VSWADDADALAREARLVLGGEMESAEELPHATRTTATSRVVRVHTTTGSAVAKLISSGNGDPTWGGSHDPGHVRYWRREPDLYEMGVPDPFLRAKVYAPTLLGSFERPGGVVLWLEDLTSAPTGGRLSPGHLGVASRRLGEAQGSYVMGRIPEEGFPWSTGALFSFLQSWEDVGWDAIYDDKMWRQSLVERHFSPQLRDSLIRFGEQRWEILEIARKLPQTICHHDVWLNNIFSFSDHVTLVDWAFVGHGHLGCDAGNIVTDACGDLLLPSSLLPEIDAAVTAGYLSGLEAAGWRGDHRTVRLGICLMAAKWSWLVPHQLRRAALDAHAVYGGRPADSDHLFRERAAMLDYLAAMASEASQLAVELGL
jgi:hypothetical protein